MSRIRVRLTALALLACSAFIITTLGCSNPGGITAPDSALESAVVVDPNSIPPTPSEGAIPDVMTVKTTNDVDG